MYKVSKFTYWCENASSELLLYNTYIGTGSFSKLTKKTTKDIFLYNDINKLNNDILLKLFDKGIIIYYDENEDAKLYNQVLMKLAPSNLNLIINPTEQCNFRCKYCYESFKNDVMSAETQKQIIKFVRENIHKYTGLNVSWFGGEPLLAFNCLKNLSEELIKICKFNKRLYEATITTNAYLLTSNTFEQLLNLKVKRYQITIDGVKILHDNQRVTRFNEPTFDVILNNLLQIKKLSRNDFIITIRINITKEIFKYFSEFLSLISSICNRDNRFNIMIHEIGNWLQKADEELIPYMINNNDLMMEGIYSKMLNFDESLNLYAGSLEPGSGSCYAGKCNNYLICSDGSLHKCTVNFEDENSVVGKLNAGFIELNSNYYNMLNSPSNCANYKNCFYAPVCMGCSCPLKKEAKYKCPPYKDKLPIVLQIIDKNKSFNVIEEA